MSIHLILVFETNLGRHKYVFGIASLTAVVHSIYSFIKGIFSQDGFILNTLKLNYTNNLSIKIARGIVFHVTPSNVPMNFAYSYIAGLLSGNNNIVRVPSKQFKQVGLFFVALAHY